MTPTLVGRWQTRFLLLTVIGLPVTFFWALVSALFGGTIGFFIPFLNLFLVFVFGFAWDAVYIFIQSFRWDRDWPPLFQLGEGFVESIWVFSINVFLWFFFGLPLNFILFAFHYWSIWWGVFLMTQGPLRILFPKWRFFGGRWI